MWTYILAALITLIIIWKVFLRKSEDNKPTFTPSSIKFEAAPKITLNNNRKKKKEKKEGQIGVIILFGSQTGTAEDFAQTIAEEATSYNFYSEVIDLEDFTVVCFILLFY